MKFDSSWSGDQQGIECFSGIGSRDQFSPGKIIVPAPSHTYRQVGESRPGAIPDDKGKTAVGRTQPKHASTFGKITRSRDIIRMVNGAEKQGVQAAHRMKGWTRIAACVKQTVTGVQCSIEVHQRPHEEP